MNYYIGDLHFGHQSILKHRTFFKNIEEHDEAIINNWNYTIKDNDDIYILGDLAYRNKLTIEEYLKQLRGNLHLIIGNHDLKWLSKMDAATKQKYFKSIQQMTMVKDGERSVILCHYPLLEWVGYFRGCYHVHGHIHANKESAAFNFLKTQDRALNAGVDICNFKPVTFKELIIYNKVHKESN